MPRLSVPGPLGMRAEHWYVFGEQAEDSNLFVQVIAPIAAVSLAEPKIWPRYTSGKTHWNPSTTPHDVLPSQSCPKFSHGCQERIGGQLCWLPLKWFWAP